MQKTVSYSRRLRTLDAASYCGSTKSTFEKFRLNGDGPTYAKIGRVVVYDVEDLDAWVESKKHRSTSEYTVLP
ncbi:helix-turn-helix transcriptional regulator [Sneathiella litorea]|uniref:helix-turn-helix transcriptional regulator n=1 Tax=Sneathiella litorea TaxID=2606216 RepID=UPI00136C6265|nr:helix-turn-helix domain-containing protein [Sneathiella litorea]